MHYIPGPWIGLLWIAVVCGVIATIAVAVASVVAIAALVVLLCFLAVAWGQTHQGAINITE